MKMTIFQDYLPGSLLGVVGGAGVLKGSQTPNGVEPEGDLSVVGEDPEPPFLAGA